MTVKREREIACGAGVLMIAATSGRFLLVRRSDSVSYPGFWNLPGGGVEPGETPEAAARREVWEEVGWSGHLLLIPTGVTASPSHSNFEFHSFLSLVDWEFMPRLNWESSDWGWFDFGQLPNPLYLPVSQFLSRNRWDIERLPDHPRVR